MRALRGAHPVRRFLLLEGVWAAVRMFGPDAPLAQAETAFDRLIG